jgi:chromosome segregation ATPase
MSDKENALNSLKQTLSSLHNKELMASNQVFDKDMEIRRLKNEVTEFRSKAEALNEEISLKKKETHDLKLDLCNVTSECKNLRNEILNREKQISMLKEKLNEQAYEVTRIFELIYFMSVLRNYFFLFTLSFRIRAYQNENQHLMKI